MSKVLAEFKNLKVYFYTKNGVVKAVNDVSFKINKGQTVAVVGESGCGKSVTSMSLMKLIPTPPGKIEDGDILFDGKSIINFKEDEMRKVRGNDIAAIYQEPMTSLNPVFTIGEQISEGVRLHLGLSKEEGMKKAIEMIKLVGIPRAEEVVKAYPHELSGGMRQRVMIAMALSCNPKLLIADEPTTALDVTIQAQILELMRSLKKELGMAIMLITHDLGVVAEMADHVVVMYAGKVVEEGAVLDLFKKPLHPYTLGLLKAKPALTDDLSERLYTIPGSVPNPIHMPDYCYFYDRCEKKSEKCKRGIPPLVELKNGQKVACWNYEEEGNDE